MTFIASLFVYATLVRAAEVALASPTERAYVPPPPLLTLPLASFDNPSVRGARADRCQFTRQGGQVSMLATSGERFSFYGGSFPDDLVDPDRVLANGFHREERVVMNELVLTWTANYKNGVLTIDGHVRGGGLPAVDHHWEFRTNSSLSAAGAASWRQSSPDFDGQGVFVSCADVPTA